MMTLIRELIKVVLLIILNLFCLISLKGSDTQSKLTPDYKQYRSIAYFTVGFLTSSSGEDFIKEYQNVTGGSFNDFDAFTVIGAGLKFQIYDTYRLGIGGDYFRGRSYEGFAQQLVNPIINRSITEDIIINSAPVIFSIEYIPYNDQFRSYFGAGVGFDYSNIEWEESVSSDFANDRRTGGTVYSANLFSPAFRLLTGIELGFDKPNQDYLLSSLIMEVRYTYVNRSAKFFSQYASQFKTDPGNINESITMMPWYLSFNIGLSINFTWRQKKN